MLGGTTGGVLVPPRRDGPACADPALSRRMPPFMVVGRVNGREEAARAKGPAEALRRMLEWLREDEEAAAVWYLREDWPAPITLVGRPRAGLVGETRRNAHLFRIEPGAVQFGALVSRCGAELHLPEIEWLIPGAGMPCVCCLALTESRRPRLEG